MQAIVTAYKGPTSNKGARMVASCQAGRLAIPYDYELSTAGNHAAAAQALAAMLGWLPAKDNYYGEWHSGSLPDDNMVHVNAMRSA